MSRETSSCDETSRVSKQKRIQGMSSNIHPIFQSRELIPIALRSYKERVNLHVQNQSRNGARELWLENNLSPSGTVNLKSLNLTEVITETKARCWIIFAYLPIVKYSLIWGIFSHAFSSLAINYIWLKTCSNFNIVYNRNYEKFSWWINLDTNRGLYIWLFSRGKWVDSFSGVASFVS